MTIDRRKYLADSLNEALPQLLRAMAKEGKGRQAVIFLQHSITMHADEKTLGNILQDVLHELRAIEAGGRSNG
jgi:hypothetical protein